MFNSNLDQEIKCIFNSDPDQEIKCIINSDPDQEVFSPSWNNVVPQTPNYCINWKVKQLDEKLLYFIKKIISILYGCMYVGMGEIYDKCKKKTGLQMFFFLSLSLYLGG